MTVRQADLEAEQEVDLGRYAATVVARWWLPALGLVVGVALGWLLAVGGEQVYVGRAVVYVGQPIGPGGGPLQSLNTHPVTVREIVTSPATVRRVAREVRVPPGKLRAGVSAQAVTAGAPARSVQNPLVAISVRVDRAAAARDAAQLLAERVVDEVGGYARGKIEALEAQIARSKSELASLGERSAAAQSLAARSTAGSTESLVALMIAGMIESRRSTLETSLSSDTQALELAQDVEQPRVLDDAVAQQTTARSKRNSLVVGGALGLLAGLIAALVWDWTATRVGRSARP
jgi:hypothetical protein